MSADLPEGWIAHDGLGCPVALDSCPAVMFRDGMALDNHLTPAAEWIFTHPNEDLWSWPERAGPADIIAYKPENPS